MLLVLSTFHISVYLLKPKTFLLEIRVSRGSNCTQKVLHSTFAQRLIPTYHYLFMESVTLHTEKLKNSLIIPD